MREHKVMVGIPSYDGRMDVNTLFTITNFQVECMQRGWGFGLTNACMISPISIARSVICRDFLRSSATDLFFIDADISCDPGYMSKMVQHPVDIVLGVYPERHLNGLYTVLGLHDGSFKRDPETGLVEIQGGPAGFMRIRRHVIEMMTAMRDETKDYLGNDKSIIPMIFETIIGSKLSCSEDINFCRRWRELGGTVWCDPDIDIHHTGRASFCSNFWKDFIVPKKLETA